MFRQLDERHSAQLTVSLEWDSATGDVQVRCEDHDSPEDSFFYLVDPESALFAFLHPFALRPPPVEQEGGEHSRSPADSPVKRRRWFRRRPQTETIARSSDYHWMWRLLDATGTADLWWWLPEPGGPPEITEWP
jgi:hypothetical protein